MGSGGYCKVTTLITNRWLEPRRDQEQGVGAGLRKLDLSFALAVPQKQCYGHCPCDCSTWQLKQQLRSTLVAMQ